MADLERTQEKINEYHGYLTDMMMEAFGKSREEISQGFTAYRDLILKGKLCMAKTRQDAFLVMNNRLEKLSKSLLFKKRKDIFDINGFLDPAQVEPEVV